MNRLMSLHQLIMMRLSLGMILVFVPVSKKTSGKTRCYTGCTRFITWSYHFYSYWNRPYDLSTNINSSIVLHYCTDWTEYKLRPLSSLKILIRVDDWIEPWLVSSHWSRTMTQNLQKEKWFGTPDHSGWMCKSTKTFLGKNQNHWRFNAI